MCVCVFVCVDRIRLYKLLIAEWLGAFAHRCDYYSSLFSQGDIFFINSNRRCSAIHEIRSASGIVYNRIHAMLHGYGKNSVVITYITLLKT